MDEKTLTLDFCPVCDQQIIPKRAAVDVPDSPTDVPAVPPPPPSSPKDGQRRKQFLRGGLVQGTGRVRPNGSIKGQPVPPPPQSKKSHKIMIDQGPYPLYCSEACRIADLQASMGAIPHDFNPNRDVAPTAPQTVPRSASTDSSSEEELTAISQSESSASADSDGRTIFDYPMPPPAAWPAKQPPKPKSKEFTTGIMMAHKYLEQTNSMRDPQGRRITDPSKKRIISGWNDGSNAWRAAVYSFSAIPTTATSNVVGVGAFDHLQNSCNSDLPCRAYDGFVASPHRAARSRRMQDVSTSAPAPIVGLSSKARSESDALLEQYTASLSRRSESRMSLSSLASPTSTSPKRERPVIPAEAEEKLLVPSVMTRSFSSGSVRSASSRSLASSVNSASRRTSRASGLTSSRPHARSPLSLGSAVEEVLNIEDLTLDDDEQVRSAGLPKPRRKAPETRSWSYDNMPTYPVMKLPPKYGQQSSKKLFLFADKPT